jgi:DNA polymerase III subunit alpha
LRTGSAASGCHPQDDLSRSGAEPSAASRLHTESFHPALGAVLDPTHGVLLYGDQVAAMLRGLGFEYEWADRFRRALATGQRAHRIDMERELKSAAQQRRWTDERINALTGLLQEHAGYLYAYGHALALAQHVLTQACAKVNPETAAAFFCDVLNNGGSAHYGLGAAVEEARRWGVVMLGPCVNRSTDRFAVENDALESVTPEGNGQQSVGAIRVPLNAIRGIGAGAARHIIAMRTAFGPFSSLLDFRQRFERGMLDRRGLLALIKVGRLRLHGVAARSAGHGRAGLLCDRRPPARI